MPTSAKRRKLKVLAFNCSLKSAHADEKSSTEALLNQLMQELKKLGADGDVVRAVDFEIKPGVTSDEGGNDAWPQLRRLVVGADIVIVATPIWLGQPSSVAKRVLERMDAFLDETDKKGRMPSYGKVGLVVVVGNEDGAHHIGAELFQAMIEVGFTIPPGGMTYWVGEAMGGKEYKSLLRTPKAVADWNPMLASNAVHLARRLKGKNYPGL